MHATQHRYVHSSHGVAQTAAALMHTLVGSKRWDPWWNGRNAFGKTRHEQFEGLAAFYVYMGEAAMAMEEAVHNAGTYDVVDFYMTLDKVVEAIFDDRLPPTHKLDEWAPLIVEQ